MDNDKLKQEILKKIAKLAEQITPSAMGTFIEKDIKNTVRKEYDPIGKVQFDKSAEFEQNHRDAASKRDVLERQPRDERPHGGRR